MSLTVEEIEQAREFARQIIPDTEQGRALLAEFERDCELVLAEARASQDGAG